MSVIIRVYDWSSLASSWSASEHLSHFCVWLRACHGSDVISVGGHADRQTSVDY